MAIKTGPLPISQFGAAAVTKPPALAAPLMEKRFMPRPPRRKHAFHASNGATAYSASSPKSKGAFPG